MKSQLLCWLLPLLLPLLLPVLAQDPPTGPTGAPSLHCVSTNDALPPVCSVVLGSLPPVPSQPPAPNPSSSVTQCADNLPCAGVFKPDAFCDRCGADGKMGCYELICFSADCADAKTAGQWIPATVPTTKDCVPGGAVAGGVKLTACSGASCGGGTIGGNPDGFVDPKVQGDFTGFATGFPNEEIPAGESTLPWGQFQPLVTVDPSQPVISPENTTVTITVTDAAGKPHPSVVRLTVTTRVITTTVVTTINGQRQTVVMTDTETALVPDGSGGGGSGNGSGPTRTGAVSSVPSRTGKAQQAPGKGQSGGSVGSRALMGVIVSGVTAFTFALMLL